MKSPLILTTLLLLACAAKSQNVGIGTTTPETILDITSTTQGILIPRLNTLQMKSIPDPLSGLLITNTDSANRVFIYTGDGWQGLAYTTEGSVLDTALLVTKAGTQTVIGSKIFSKDLVVNGISVGLGAGNIASNTVFGNNALKANTTGFLNIAIGINSLRLNTTGRTNVAMGDSALYANTTGLSNIAIGSRALRSNTTGYQNHALGTTALYSNTTGLNNLANGFTALYSNTSGSFNVGEGLQALYYNSSGISNTAAGSYALFSNTTGNQNSGFGRGAFYNNTTGSNNIAIGFNSGRYLADGVSSNAIANNSIFIGTLSKALVSNQTNQIVIGYNALGDGSNTAVLGNTAITSTKLFGQLRLPSYGSGAVAGTPTFNLATDATGNIIEVASNSRLTPLTLIDGATITWDIANSLKINAEITLTGSGRALAIDNPVDGETYKIKIIQDGTGGRTITNWPANTKWPSGIEPTLTVLPNSYDIISFYFDGTNFNGTVGLNYF